MPKRPLSFRTGLRPSLLASALALTAIVLPSGQVVGQNSRQPAPPGRQSVTVPKSVQSFAPMLAAVIPAVVTILVTGETAEPVDLPPRNADGRPPTMIEPRKVPFRSGGTGVIVDPKSGYILTNNHVIADAVRIEVTLWDGRRMRARLVGRDIGTDIAVIEISERNLPGIPIGNSDKVRVGDVVLAVGNPYGLEGTATRGIVSALMRTAVGHEAFEDFMQIDAAINPGNSGGALVNTRGELIGINTAGPSDPGRASGIGFAIPINMARAIKAELIAHGQMRRGSPGLIVEDLTYELMQEIGTRVTRGARIVEVIAGSSAAAAGIEPGGIITAMSGKPVRTAAEFDTRVATVPIGSELAVTIVHNEQPNAYRLKASQLVLKPKEVVVPADLSGIAGAVVGDILIGNPLFGSLRGAQVLHAPMGTRAHAAGLEAGDVIVGLDGATIRSSGDLMRLAARASMQFRVKIVRAGAPAWVRVVR